MSHPLPVSPGPLVEPSERSVLIEVLVQYPGSEANQVDVGYYLNDPASIELIEGGVGSYRECYTPAITSDGCSIQVPSVSSSGFQQIIGISVITFTYVDAADFFWFEPDGTAVLEYEVPDVPQWQTKCTADGVAVACSPSAAVVSVR